RSLCHIHAVFFFSSRRRHTRWPRDWSSDVCSSDLSGGTVAGRAGMGVRYQRSSGNDRRRSREPRGVTWLIKEFFNMTVSQTLKTCTLLVLVVGCETVMLKNSLMSQVTPRSEEHTSELQS